MIWFGIIIVPYILIILTGWYYLGKRDSIDKIHKIELTDTSLPLLTIIVPIKNEEESLPYIITDLRNQDYPDEKIEVIFVDDHSTDETYNIISQLSAESEVFEAIKSVGEGKKYAISSALSIAKGDLIITTDADCRLPERWSRTFSEWFIKTKADLLIGQVNPQLREGIGGGLMELEFISLQALTAGLALAGRAVMCNGANLGFRKLQAEDYIDSVQKEARSGDDIFLLHHIKKSEGKVVWVNDKMSAVTTRMPQTFKRFLNQRRRWVSKAGYYNDIDTILTGLATFIANISIVITTLLMPVISGIWKLALLLIISKAVVDLLIISRYLTIQKMRRLMVWFLPAAVVYPFYSTLTTLLGIFPSRKW